MTFGDHLRADQNIDLALFPATNQLLVGASFGSGISVHARDARLRDKPPQCFLDAFRPAANLRKRGICAFRADIADRPAIVAVMAGNAFLFLMHGQSHAAVGTAPSVAAQSTLQEIGEATAIKKNERLTARSQIF